MGMMKVWFDNQQAATEAEFLLKYNFAGAGFSVRTETGASVKPRVVSEGGMVSIAPGPDFEVRVYGEDVENVDKFCKAKGWSCERR